MFGGGATLYLKGLAADDEFVQVNLSIDGHPDIGDYVSAAVDSPITVRWSHRWIYPVFPPGLAATSLHQGDDRNNQLSEVELVIDAPDLPANAPATVTVHRCSPAEEAVAHAALVNLQLDGQGQVVTAGGQRPVFTIDGRANCWKPFGTPFLF